MRKYNLLTIIGPTAVGKTAVAVHVARRLNGEVLSGDSRQVYRGMDIGTGKDLSDYTAGGPPVPYHLIDIVEAGARYDLYRYTRDFDAACRDICARGATPILCGGSGLYIEAVTRGYQLPDVPVDTALRAALASKTDRELSALLASLTPLHNTTDTCSRQRTLRAIEVALHTQQHPPPPDDPRLPIRPLFAGLTLPRELRRERITRRLHERLQNGLVEEAERLLRQGLSTDDLLYYGLEYKFVALYLLQTISYDEMVERLNTAIHQFAKRQMTWFRGMERRGATIHWIDATLPMEEKVEAILRIRD
jgi:tRNA dimethylallyltransferase